MVSESLLEEIQDVLMRPKFRRYLAADDVAPYLQRLRRVATLADEGDEVPRYTEDRDDDYLVELTLKSGADLLVSRDGDLLDSLEELPVKIIGPEGFMERLRATG